MSQASQHRKQKITITVLVVLLLIVTLWAIQQAYPVIFAKFFAPTLEETATRIHPLYVEVRTDKNLTMDEVLGFGEEQKTILMLPDTLYFFELSPGLNFSREIEIINPYRNTLKLEGKVTGDISQFTSYKMEENIKPFTRQVATITVQIPEKVEAGKYKGNFTVTFTPLEKK